MLKKLRVIKNNTYIMQIATLMSGTLIAQVVTLAFIPIITHLYTPSEFGLYALFFSVVSILGLVSSAKYDQAIMLPKSDKDAQALVFLSVLITLVVVIILIISLLIFQDFFIDYFNGNEIFLWMLPFGVALVGILQIFNAYSSRKQFYKKLATVKIVNSFSVAGIQSVSKYFFKFDGLVLGKLFADALSLVLLIVFHIKKNTLQLKALSKKRMLVNAKKHKHFPKYQSFTVFLNATSQNLPVLLLASLYSPEIAGYYALTVRVLRTPITLIGSATREVYYQKASKMFANQENFFNLYYKTTIGLFKLFIVPFLIVFLFGDLIFSLVFGTEWGVSGDYSKILIFWYLFAFINSPSIMTFSILKMQLLQLKIELISLFLRAIALYLGYYLFNDPKVSITLFVVISTCINIILILIIFKKLKYKKENIHEV